MRIHGRTSGLNGCKCGASNTGGAVGELETFMTKQLHLFLSLRVWGFGLLYLSEINLIGFFPVIF